MPRLRPIYAFIARDVKRLFRDKASLFWVIVWPIIWILMTAYVFAPMAQGTPVTLSLGVVVEDNTTGPFNATTLLEVLGKVEYNGTRLFRVKTYPNTSSLVEAIRKGYMDAGIIVPQGFSKNITFGQAHLEVLIGASGSYKSSIAYAVLSTFISELNKRIGLMKANITLSYIRMYFNTTPPWWNTSSTGMDFYEAMEEYYRGLASPINASIRYVKPESVANRGRIIGWYTIGAVGMMLLYTGFNIGAGIVVSEREGGVLRRILSQPISEGELLVGKILGSTTSMLIASIIAILAGYAVGAEIYWNPLRLAHWVAVLMLVVGTLLSIGLGILLSLLAKTPSGASSLGTALGLLLAFTAGVWFPKEWMPGPLQLLADYFPVTWSLDAMRGILLYNRGLSEVSGQVLGSLMALVAVYVMAIFIYKRVLRKYSEA